MSFLEIFQPGLKHLREERERQRMNVAHPTNGADPLMEIDLDAGTARIVVPAGSRSTTGEPAESAQPDADEADGAGEPVADEADHAEAKADETGEAGDRAE